MKTSILTALFVTIVSVSAFSQKQPGVFDAVKRNDTTTLYMCLNSGLKVNTTGVMGNSLLMEASKNGSYAAAKMLLAHGAKVNAVNEMGNTALMEASLRGDAQMVAILLQSGANTAMINQVGETALTIAEGFDKTAVAKLITDRNQNSKEGYASLR